MALRTEDFMLSDVKYIFRGMTNRDLRITSIADYTDYWGLFKGRMNKLGVYFQGIDEGHEQFLIRRKNK